MQRGKNTQIYGPQLEGRDKGRERKWRRERKEERERREKMERRGATYPQE